LQIDIITLFPEIFFGPFKESIIGRAIKQGLVEINAINLRQFTHDERGTVDDKPYGGGPGMLMKAEPLFEAVESLRRAESLVILTSPQGKRFNQQMAAELKEQQHLIIICGHYEGVDERVRTGLVDLEISIGDYVLTSGNLAAMVMTDAMVRLLPGVLGCDESSVSESFSGDLLEYPQYTRPADFRGMTVPEVLLSGNHGEIASWRQQEALKRTRQMRPDLLRPEQV
jgi:tRNA (guanine37-N1)-methyltransferase